MRACAIATDGRRDHLIRQDGRGLPDRVGVVIGPSAPLLADQPLLLVYRVETHPIDALIGPLAA